MPHGILGVGVGARIATGFTGLLPEKKVETVALVSRSQVKSILGSKVF